MGIRNKIAKLNVVVPIVGTLCDKAAAESITQLILIMLNYDKIII